MYYKSFYRMRITPLGTLDVKPSIYTFQKCRTGIIWPV